MLRRELANTLFNLRQEKRIYDAFQTRSGIIDSIDNNSTEITRETFFIVLSNTTGVHAWFRPREIWF